MHRSSSARPGHEGFAGKVAGASLLASAALGASLLTAGSAAAARAEVHRPATSAAVEVPFLGATTTKSFAATTSSLKTAVSSAGMMVLGQLNQAGALSVTGLHLKGAETFFVGNPTTGKKLFAMDPAVGAVIPVRMYVWVDGAGQTEVGYLQPSALGKAVSPALAKPLTMLDGVAAKVVRSVTGHVATALGVVKNLSFVQVASNKSFAATTSSLKTAVSSAGMMVLGQLNQAGALSVTGLHLKGAETFFVGNPTTGKKLFAMDPAVGIEIPLGMYLWVDHAGRTEIGYFHPAQVLTAVSVKFKAFSAMFDSIAERVAHSAS